MRITLANDVPNKKVRVFFVIPARFASTRLAGKPLLLLAGKPVVERVLENVFICKQKLQEQIGDKILEIHVVVATDNERIARAVAHLDVKAVLTSPELPSGTDRIYAALSDKKHNFILDDNDIVVNIQGDEPFFVSADIVDLIDKMISMQNIPMGTIAFPRTEFSHFIKSSVVKVVVDDNNLALYFSRAPVPWPREIWGASGTNWVHNMQNNKEHVFLHHVGIYVFRWNALCKFATELIPSNLEKAEGLEQLRALSAGWKIFIGRSSRAPMGIDTSEDLVAAESYFTKFLDTEV